MYPQMSDKKGTRSYLRNFQTQRRRRREGKTDYQHRFNMLRQDCHHYGEVKSRLVVRFTNTKCICSVVKAYIDGDRIVASADSTELKNYGVDFGLNNTFAAYATAFLCARRALATKGLDQVYQPKQEIGEYGVTEELEERKAYKVFLDIGLSRSSRGAKVFIAMKGASDAGLQIPHSEVKFYGYTEEKGLDAKVLRDRIFMKTTVDYMVQLRENDEDAYKKQFSQYIAKGIAPESIQNIYEQCLKSINENFERVKKERNVTNHYNAVVPKLTLEERKAGISAKLNAGKDQQ